MTKLNRIKKSIRLIVGTLIFLPATALAIDVPVPPNVKGPDTNTIVTGVVNTLLWVSGIAAVIAIIAGGIMYISSGGDEKRVQTAKNTILYAVVGMIVAIFAYAIASLVVKGVTTGGP